MTKLSLVMVLICIAAVHSYTLGSREHGDTNGTVETPRGVKSGAVVILEGRVRLVGNEPFRELIITDDKDIQWYLDEEGQDLLMGFEQEIVRVKGTVERKKMVLANGTKLLERLTLHNVVVIE